MRKILFSGILWLLLLMRVSAQQSHLPDSVVTLRQALQIAEVNFPQLLAQKQQVASAQNKVGLAKNDALPRLDIHLQGNYATANNSYGLFYPQLSLPPISGPVNETNTYQGSFGSAAGILF